MISVVLNKRTVSSVENLLDNRSKVENKGFEALIVLDDRRYPDAAASERRVLNSIGNVWSTRRALLLLNFLHPCEPLFR